MGEVPLRGACTSGSSWGRAFVARSLTVEVASVSVFAPPLQGVFDVERGGWVAVTV